jgi:hypothetical protein
MVTPIENANWDQALSKLVTFDRKSLKRLREMNHQLLGGAALPLEPPFSRLLVLFLINFASF